MPLNYDNMIGVHQYREQGLLKNKCSSKSKYFMEATLIKRGLFSWITTTNCVKVKFILFSSCSSLSCYSPVSKRHCNCLTIATGYNYASLLLFSFSSKYQEFPMYSNSEMKHQFSFLPLLITLIPSVT